MSKTLTLTHYEHGDWRWPTIPPYWPQLAGEPVLRVEQTVYVGQRVQVWSYGRNREGTVTKLGRTRVTVNYKQNRQGVRNEKAFSAVDVTVGREHVKRTPA